VGTRVFRRRRNTLRFQMETFSLAFDTSFFDSGRQVTLRAREAAIQRAST
jgi:hypothetical protein